MSAQCDDVRERLAAGEETGAPDLVARALVAEHLASCDACRAVAAALLDVDDALTSMPVMMPPPALSRAVIERVRAESTATESTAAESTAERAPVQQPSSRGVADARGDVAVPAGRLAIAALIAAILALLEAPFALLRWLARPRRAVFALGTGAVGAAGAVLMLTLSSGGDREEDRVPGADAMIEPVEVTTTTTESGPVPAVDHRIGYFDRTIADATGEVVHLARLDDDRGALESGAFGWREGELDRRDGRFAAQTTPPSAGEPSEPAAADELPPEVPEEAEQTHRPRDALRAYAGLGQTRDGEGAAQNGVLGNVERDGDLVAQQVARPRPSGRDTAWLSELERTEGLALQARRGWWENTYVPGDPALRVLHRRLASSSSAPIAGASLSALALAELASPARPAISVPRDAAVALGVQADVRAVEGTQRVRVEVGMRAMERAAGRRDPMRVAVVIDARAELRESAEAHVRAVLDALGRARGARDRIAIYAAGASGGEILALGALRHGEVEVALRRLFATQDTAGASVSLGDALGAAITTAGSGEGAGLVLLLTTGAAPSDASVEPALHAGALAGVPTTAIAIDDAASLEHLDAIALAGQGRRRSVASAEDADRAVRGELEAASRIVARALRLELRLGAGVELVDVIGSRSLDAVRTARAREAERTVDRELAASLGIASDRGADDDGLVIYLPAFHAGASHTVLLDLVVRGPGAVLEVDLRYKDLVRLRNGRATGALSLSRGRPSRGPAELRVVSRLLGAELASALAEAGDRLAAGDASGARARLEQARERILAACDATPGLATERVVIAELALAERYLAALSSEPSPLLAASMRYAARRHAVVPATETAEP